MLKLELFNDLPNIQTQSNSLEIRAILIFWKYKVQDGVDQNGQVIKIIFKEDLSLEKISPRQRRT